MSSQLLIPEVAPMMHEPTVMEIISQAVLTGNVSVDVMERLCALQRQIGKDEAEKQFNSAMNRCQDKMRPISADALNPQTKSRYATYAKLDKALRPIYTPEGFSLSFNGADCPLPDHERVLCYVSRDGYTRTYQADVPNDGKGAKGGDVMTKTHASGAAKSYGMRYLLKMIFNVAVGEDDDDGNLIPPEVAEQRGRIIHGMERAQGEDELTSLYRAGVKDALSAKDYAGIKMLDQTRDKRRRELAGEVD